MSDARLEVPWLALAAYFPVTACAVCRSGVIEDDRPEVVRDGDVIRMECGCEVRIELSEAEARDPEVEASIVVLCRYVVGSCPEEGRIRESQEKAKRAHLN